MEGKVAASVLALCGILFIQAAQAGIGLGACPTRSVINSINLSKYAGRWYENSSFGAFFEFNGKCVQAVYTPKADGSIEVINALVDKTTQNVRHIKGSAVPEDHTGDGKLKVTFPMGWMNRTGSYYVLDTDYDNYALVYSCRDMTIARYELGWILSRKPILDDKFKQHIDSVLSANKLDPSQYKPTTQDCGAIDCSKEPCQITPTPTH